jgi:hypothetical protein
MNRMRVRRAAVLAVAGLCVGVVSGGGSPAAASASTSTPRHVAAIPRHLRVPQSRSLAVGLTSVLPSDTRP